MDPVNVTMSLAKGAMKYGTKIYEGVTIKNILTDTNNSKVTGVITNDDHIIQADIVVNCAGMWARQLGDSINVNIPNQAAEHYYLITDTMENVDSSWPIIEDPSSYTYIRPENDGLMIGLFEPNAKAWNVNHIPDDFSFGEIEPDYERMQPYLEKAMSRVPDTMNVGIKKFFCGPESFVPDLYPILGEAPELKNYYVAAGLNSIGILSGGGIGKLMSTWIYEGLPNMDVTAMNIDRLQSYHNSPLYRSERVVESLGMVYKPHYPTYSMKSARNVKFSPLHSRLKELNAYFRDVSGFEAADWFAPLDKEAKQDKLTWNRHNWFPYWEMEHLACRNNVILLDMSFMSKFLIQGQDAGKLLNYLSTANVNDKINQITYTQWLNHHGKMEADLTIIKLHDEKFIVIATDTAHRHVETWIKKHIGIKKEHQHVTITDITGAYAQINIQGPNSRKLMEEITNNNLDNENFPFRAVKEVYIGYAKILMARITYLGELGYELYIPTEMSLHVYDYIKKIGDKYKLKNIGLKALSSLRMEKGYRDYGHDMDNTDTIMEVGLSFTCDFNKKDGFIGKDAVLKQKAQGIKSLKQRLVQVLIKDPYPFMFHGEIIYRNNEIVGDIRAASYGHTLKGAVGLGMIQNPNGGITKSYIENGTFQVDIAGKKYDAIVSLAPLYDPNNLKIKK